MGIYFMVHMQPINFIRSVLEGVKARYAYGMIKVVLLTDFVGCLSSVVHSNLKTRLSTKF
jgi:hypothetical protein